MAMWSRYKWKLMGFLGKILPFWYWCCPVFLLLSVLTANVRKARRIPDAWCCWASEPKPAAAYLQISPWRKNRFMFVQDIVVVFLVTCIWGHFKKIFILFIYLFYCSIVALQRCISFCCTMKWIGHMHSYVLPLGPPSRPSPIPPL